MNLTFSLARPADRDSDILVTIRTPGQDPEFSLPTGINIPTGDWDRDRQRPKNIYLKKYKRINTLLDSIKVELAGHILRATGHRRPVSERAVSELLQKVAAGKGMPGPEDSFLALTEKYIESRRGMICHSTCKRYRVFLELFRRFEGFTRRHLTIEDVRPAFVNEFMAFGKEESYSESTLHRSLNFVRTVLNFAERNGRRTHRGTLEIRRHRHSPSVVTLTEKEIQRIRATDVPPEYQQSKEWLLISCYTGQRISDFMDFRKGQLIEMDSRACISFTQQKTRKDMVIPLHPVVKAILERNGNDFPPSVEHGTYNRQIRLVARLAGINEMVRARKRVGHRSQDTRAEKWEMLSSHIGRRSFATNFYGRIPTPLLMQATGHSTEKMFLSYIDHHGGGRIASLGTYFEKLHSAMQDGMLDAPDKATWARGNDRR